MNILQRYAAGRTYANVSPQDVTLDLSLAQVLEACITPGASGNVDTIRSWGITRFA